MKKFAWFLGVLPGVILFTLALSLLAIFSAKYTLSAKRVSLAALSLQSNYKGGWNVYRAFITLHEFFKVDKFTNL